MLKPFLYRDAVVSHFDEYVDMFAIKGISELTNVTGTYKSFLAQSAIKFSKTYIPFESIVNFTTRRGSRRQVFIEEKKGLAARTRVQYFAEL